MATARCQENGLHTTASFPADLAADPASAPVRVSIPVLLLWVNYFRALVRASKLPSLTTASGTSLPTLFGIGSDSVPQPHPFC